MQLHNTKLYPFYRQTPSFKGFERIKCPKAKSIQEAKSFAHNILKIPHYEISDLSVANWVNKGLTYIYNLYRGKVGSVQSVQYKYSFFNHTAIATPAKGKIVLNKKIFKHKIDRLIKNQIKKITDENGNLIPTFDVKQNSIVAKWIKLYKSKDLPPAAKLRLLTKFYEYKTEVAFMYQEKHFDTNIQTALNWVHKLCPNINFELKTQTTQDKRNTLIKIVETLNRLGFRHNNFSKKNKECGIFEVLIHEIGHIFHLQENPNMRKSFCCKSLNDVFLEKQENFSLANEVSNYATKNVFEFVAETYMRLIRKLPVSEKVLEKYHNYSGPSLPENF